VLSRIDAVDPAISLFAKQLHAKVASSDDRCFITEG
jgi:hypothetical protein